MSEWEYRAIESFADVRGGKRLPKGDSLVEYPTPYPYIRLVDVVGNRVSDGNLLYLTQQIQQKISRYIVNAEDICLAIVGHTIGMVFFIDAQWDGANLTENAARITNVNRAMVLPEYLFHYLCSPIGQYALRTRIVGSAQGKLPIYNIRQLEIPLPPLDEQRAITHILGSLDDKIEANRRLNETLEATARAIFKSWFVDFDPVHYKARGEHPPGMDAATAALFPDSFEESALGPIPRGWGVGGLNEAVRIIGGGTPKTSTPEYWDGDIP